MNPFMHAHDSAGSTGSGRSKEKGGANTSEKDSNGCLPEGSLKKKGFWGRYLDRLNRATGGKPPSCCGG